MDTPLTLSAEHRRQIWLGDITPTDARMALEALERYEVALSAAQAEAAALRQAVGLMTTLKGDLVMDVEHPLEMMQAVHKHVSDEAAALRERVFQVELTLLSIRLDADFGALRDALFVQIRDKVDAALSPPERKQP